MRNNKYLWLALGGLLSLMAILVYKRPVFLKGLGVNLPENLAVDSQADLLDESVKSSRTIELGDPFDQTIDLKTMRYPTVKTPYQFSNCDEEWDQHFEDPYEFVAGLGFSRVDFVQDQGDLEYMSAFLHWPNIMDRDGKLKGDETRLPDEPPQSATSNEDMGAQGTQVPPKVSEDRTSQDISVGIPNQETFLPKFRREFPFIKLEVSREINEAGKYRLRAYAFRNAKLDETPMEIELAPDLLVLQSKAEIIQSLKTETNMLLSQGARLGSRSALISMEYSSLGEQRLVTVEFMNGDMARLKASGVECVNNSGLLACVCTPQAEMP